MSYSKPQVTIDLDEYNELLKAKQFMNESLEIAKEDTKPYKAAIGAMLSYSMDNFQPNSFQRLIESTKRVDVIMIINKLQRGGDAWDVHCEIKQIQSSDQLP